MANRHLTLYDVRDLDLMLRIQDSGDDRGEISAVELADALGMDEDTRAVAMRLAWMRRYGMLDYHEERKTWGLANGGRRVIEAKSRAANTDVIPDVPDEQLVDVMAHVTTRYRLGDPVIATLLRREFAYGTAPHSAAWQMSRGRRRR
jgi:hypothetical protein